MSRTMTTMAIILMDTMEAIPVVGMGTTEANLTVMTMTTGTGIGTVTCLIPQADCPFLEFQ